MNAVIIKDDRILLIAFDDESGFHYNLPGGGVEVGEPLHDAVRREAREEAAAEIEVGRLLLVWEYLPTDANPTPAGIPLSTRPQYQRHRLNLCFECHLKEGSQPRLPDQPDEDQVGVQWIALAEFAAAPLIPPVQAKLLAALQQNDYPDLFVHL
ncbi:MAG: NUDIX domain-containing protein [Anaerolineae bacterium]|nr:NUDIX domain-containing protein [Anaerolineae bacterium]